MYDLHIGMTGNTPSATVALDFRCTITQWTGEDWENISLALTTADQVSQLIQLPEPKRIDISLGQTSLFPPLFGQSGGFNPPTQSRQIVLNEGTERDREVLPGPWGEQAQIAWAHAPPVPPGPVVDEAARGDAPSQPQAVSQLISRVCVDRHAIIAETPLTLFGLGKIQDSKDPITHIANGCIFIPSDHAAHHVLVASLSLQAEFMRVVVPSIDTRVYYTVRHTFLSLPPVLIQNV